MIQSINSMRQLNQLEFHHTKIVIKMENATDTSKVYRFEIECCKCGQSSTVFAKKNEISIVSCEGCKSRDYRVKMVNIFVC